MRSRDRVRSTKSMIVEIDSTGSRCYKNNNIQNMFLKTADFNSSMFVAEVAEVVDQVKVVQASKGI